MECKKRSQRNLFLSFGDTQQTDYKKAGCAEVIKCLNVLILLLFILVFSCEEAQEPEEEEIPPDTTPPVVEITSPLDGSAVFEIVTITCSATDNDSVMKVALWIDGDSTGLADTTAPFSFTWNVSAFEDSSTYLLMVRAYDLNGNHTNSAPVSVMVDNSTALPTTPTLFPITRDSSTITIQWSQNHDSDFQSWSLYESNYEDMVGASEVYSSDQPTDTNYVMSVFVEEEYKYYQIQVVDTLGLESWSNIERVSTHITFIRTFGGNYDDKSFSVVQTGDTGYAAVGHTYSYGAGQDAWLVKTDEHGNELWNNTYAFRINETATYIIETSDGGFVFTGSTFSFNQGYDLIIIKTDGTGTQIWQEEYNDHVTSYLTAIGQCIQELPDGGFIVTGYSGFLEYDDIDMWTIRTNSEGDDIWNKLSNDLYSDWGYSLKLLDDGGFILAGAKTFSSTGPSDVWLVKLDADGNEIWNQQYGYTGADQAREVLVNDDGSLAIAGSLSFPTIKHFWLIKTDDQGNFLWSNIFGGSGNDVCYAAAKTEDGGYILAGYTESYGNGSKDAWLVKTDENGTEEWNKTFGGSLNDVARSIRQTDDGGFIIAGNTQSFGSGMSDFYLIKTDPEGNVYE